MRRIALTGGIATGKSHVLARFAAVGVPTIDADVLAHDVVAPGTPGLATLVDTFGKDVLDPSGALDRRKLGALVFADAEQRRRLEGIVHPAVRAAIEQWFTSLPSSTPFAIADIPLLYETGRAADFEKIIVTAGDPETQVRRIMARDGLSEQNARARVASQIPIAEKVLRADYVIDTNGSLVETNAQVEAVYNDLVGRS